MLLTVAVASIVAPGAVSAGASKLVTVRFESGSVIAYTAAYASTIPVP